MFSTVKWWGRIWLPLLFLGARVIPATHGTLAKLSFIHFARWTLVKRLPYNGPPQSKDRLHYTHMFFESNFNGGWEEYIDAFSHILTRGMIFFWGSSYGFPQPLPTAPFKQYIRENELDAAHFYSAYPDYTTTMVRAALDIEPKLSELKRRAAGMSPEEFASAWQALLTEHQGEL